MGDVCFSGFPLYLIGYSKSFVSLPRASYFSLTPKEKYPKETVPENLFAARIPSILSFIGTHPNSLRSLLKARKAQTRIRFSQLKLRVSAASNGIIKPSRDPPQ